MTCPKTERRTETIPSLFTARCLRCSAPVALELWEVEGIAETLRKNPTMAELVCACQECGVAADSELREAYPRGYVGLVDLKKG